MTSHVPHTMINHVSHRTLSVPARPEVAMDRQPHAPRGGRATRGHVGRTPGGRNLCVLPLYQDAATLGPGGEMIWLYIGQLSV